MACALGFRIFGPGSNTNGPLVNLILTMAHMSYTSKLLVSPFIAPRRFPHIIPYITPLNSLEYSSYGS